MSRVEVQNLDVNFGQVHGVRNASFTVEEGEMVGLLGPSGCGKTTILRTIAGLNTATGGRIQIGDAVVSDPQQGVFVAPQARGLGMVFQSYAIWPHMTVAENVGFPLKVRNRPAAEIRERVMRVLDIVELGFVTNRPATELSGGQQQRVAIARSLIFEPRVLLLDEPLSNVDAKLRLQMGHEMRSIQRRAGVTTIYVTHDQMEALSLCDRIVVLKQGIVQQVGSPQDVYQQPCNAFVGWFIGNASFLQGTIEASTRPAVRGSAGEAVALIRLEGLGSLSASIVGEPVSAGATVTIMIRPEDIQLAAGSSVGFAATVEQTSYLGDRWYYQASVGQQVVGFYTERGRILSPGDAVRLDVGPSAICFSGDDFRPETMV